ncbi:MAG TPA: PAS domain S-box protein [Candidatus Binatia bacterium]|jgi:PAS domain S-box-containing protein|nr:PAS domain S-box protein [Candidatus Binatia bacterium]
MTNDPETQAPSWLRATGDPFRMLFELTHDAVIFRSMDERITFWNHAAEAQYGWTAAEAIGQRSHDLLRTQFPKALEQIKAELRASGRWEGELLYTTRAGRVVAVASRWSLQLDKDGTPCAILEINTDITDRKEGEEARRQVRDQLELRVQARTADLEAVNEALVESQERFRQMAENIREVFWLSNPTMTSIIYVSPAYQRIWGRTCQELYENPRSWFDAIHPEDRPRALQIFRAPLPEGGYEHAYRVIRPEGSVRWVLERGFPVRNNIGRFYRLVGIARDITERKNLETEILAISEREQRRIGQDLHDDLCQQLVGIEFLSQALQQQLAGQPHAVQASEIAQLIRAAIDHTRLLSRGLAPIELEAEGLMEGLRGLAARTRELFRVQCSFQCPTPVLVGDVTLGTYLYRIAQEAVTNGIKHGKAKQIEIRLAPAAEGAVLSVKDNGAGFSEKVRNPRGMGLRSMQYRADMIGGTFAIRPGVQGGTIVECAFPLPPNQPTTITKT